MTQFLYILGKLFLNGEGKRMFLNTRKIHWNIRKKWKIHFKKIMDSTYKRNRILKVQYIVFRDSSSFRRFKHQLFLELLYQDILRPGSYILKLYFRLLAQNSWQYVTLISWNYRSTELKRYSRWFVSTPIYRCVLRPRQHEDRVVATRKLELWFLDT